MENFLSMTGIICYNTVEHILTIFACERMECFMRKRMLLLALLCLLALAFTMLSAQAEVKIPEMESYTDGVFYPIDQQDFGTCLLASYESVYASEDEMNEILESLQAYMMEFRDGSFEYIDGYYAGDESPLLEFGWFRYIGDDAVTPFGFQFLGQTVNSCDVFIAGRLYEDKIQLDLYYANEMKPVDKAEWTGKTAFGPVPAVPIGPIAAVIEEEVAPSASPLPQATQNPASISILPAAPTQAPAASPVLPSFEAFAQDAILQYEDGMYFLKAEEGSLALEAYFSLLEEYGLANMQSEEVDGLLCLWFEEYTPGTIGKRMTLEQGDLLAEGYVFFILGAYDDEMMLVIETSEEFSIEDTGERYLGGADEPTEIITVEESDGKVRIPSFASYAQNVISRTERVRGVNRYTIPIENTLVLDDYAELLEEYGLYQLDGTETGMPLYNFIERYEGDAEPGQFQVGDDKFDYYVIFTLWSVSEDGAVISVEYLDIFDAEDLGIRWK